MLLLDEPFGALDAKVRQELRQWLRRLHDEIHVTSVFVTHDQEEAFEVADRVVVMNKGRIEQVGTPGRGVRASGQRVRDGLPRQRERVPRPGRGAARPSCRGLELAYPDYPHAEARDASVYVRPHELQIERSKNGEASLEAKVVHVNPTGLAHEDRAARDRFDALINAELTAERFAELALKSGDTVHVSPRRVRVFTEPPPRENGNDSGRRAAAGRGRAWWRPAHVTATPAHVTTGPPQLSLNPAGANLAPRLLLFAAHVAQLPVAQRSRVAHWPPSCSSSLPCWSSLYIRRLSGPTNGGTHVGPT